MAESRIFRPGLLDGQVVLVTGGGSGLGRATVIELTALGARVVVAGRRLEPLEETVGLCADGLCSAVACDIRAKGWNTVVQLNLGGTWLMTHAVATRAMIPAGGGKIVNVTLSPHHGLPAMAHSSAARAAVENMTRVLSIEWARFQIKLTAIATGHFETEALSKYPEPVRRGVATTVPLQRLGQPEEQAWLVAFLASPA